MKYIILNDLDYIIIKKSKLYISYLLVILLYYLICKDIYISLNKDDFFNNIFAYRFNFKLDIKNIMNFSFIILNLIIYFYITITVFIKDLYNMDNLFTRISFTKWLVSKIIVQLIFNFLLSLFIFIIIVIFEKQNVSLEIFVIKKTLFVTIASMWIYILFLIKRRNYLFNCLLLIALVSIMTIEINLVNIKFLCLFSSFVISFLILLVLSFYSSFSNMKGSVI